MDKELTLLEKEIRLLRKLILSNFMHLTNILKKVNKEQT